MYLSLSIVQVVLLTYTFVLDTQNDRPKVKSPEKISEGSEVSASNMVDEQEEEEFAGPSSMQRCTLFIFPMILFAKSCSVLF